MVPYDKIVLNKLLDKYEASLLSTGQNERTVHIEFRFIKKNLPAYFDESSEEYENIHTLMQQLEDKKLIKIIWKDNKKGHVILKIQLNVEQLERAYTYVKRISKSELVIENVNLLNGILEQTNANVSCKFINYLLERLKENKSVKEFIELGNRAETSKLLKAIQAIEHNKQQLYLREFSIQTFQDSKVFEKMLGKVHRIFERFEEGTNPREVSEWLAEYNIYQTPNFVYLKGKGCISLKNREIELDIFAQGLGISGEDIEEISILKSMDIKKIITIENLTTYFRWQEDNSLLIYLGGYHNQVRRNLLKKIYMIYPKAGYYHFGDIDAGGFEIYRNLCEKTKIPFQMYYMDLATLKKYEKYGKRLTENDKKRLEDMRNSEELHEIINYMLEHDVKLEQECIGLERFN